MNSVFIEATKSSPQIDFNLETNTLKISGQSYPENAMKFYNPIFIWLDEYLKDIKEEVLVEIKIIYLNTSSSKCMFDIFEKLNNAYLNGVLVKLHWYYKDGNRNMMECGEELVEDVDFPFEIISFNN
jgi:cellulose synthase/poly-beta-1,6-N-acetylglucosamine synthase-like glycosyltransferase